MVSTTPRRLVSRELVLLSVASPLMSVLLPSVDHLFYYSVVLLAIQRFTTTEKEKYANGLNSNCL